jgi:type I protein arginine methyltransferase
LQSGIAHGIRAWFISEQGEGFFTDNSIENPKATYGAPLFPFEEPIMVNMGDQIEFSLKAIHDKGEYTFSWNTQIFTPDGELKAAFIQSTLANNLMSASKFLTQSEFYQPKLNEKAEIENFILSNFDGEALNGDIADALLEKFPEKFAGFDEALARVGEVALRFHDQ